MGQEDYLATLTAKTVPIPIGRTGFGLAIAGAVVYDPGKQTGNGFIVNVPVTFDFSKESWVLAKRIRASKPGCVTAPPKTSTAT